MEWINRFDLFLFDFDGLLVTTEELHFQAYQQMCRERGYQLPWNLSQYLHIAHLSATGIREGLYREFPPLQKAEWSVLYAEKKKAYEDSLAEGRLSLLPGVAEVLQKLEQMGKRRCVVTNSARVQIDLIKEKLPLLNTIPVWITRENYKDPKPSPECYLKAVKMLGKPGDRIIGFEDSLRGLQALQGAGVEHALLICPPDHPQLTERPRFYFPSFEAISSDVL